MWRGQDKVWMTYLNGIVAADLYSAVLLSSYMRQSVRTCQYAQALEIIDLQRYKMIRQFVKVRKTLKKRIDLPFIFVIGKN